MYRFLKLINDFKDYFLLIILVIISFSLISINSTQEIGGFRALVIGTVGHIQNFFSWLPNSRALQNENKTLVELNLQLSTEVALMRKAWQENKGLRAMLELQPHSQYKLISCDVISKNVVQMRNFVMINRGTADSIQIGMAVQNEAGLIGCVSSVQKNIAMVELLNNRNVKIPTVLSKSAVNGIIGWEGDEFLILNNVPKTVTVEIGEIASTSLFSSKYPANLPIGTVEKILDEPGSHFNRILIKPIAQFFNFSQLFVVDYIQDEQIITLAKEVEKKILMLEKRKK